MVRKLVSRKVLALLGLLGLLVLPAVANAQNGFPPPQAPVDQYEQPPQNPPPGGNPGQGNGPPPNTGRPPRRGGEAGDGRSGDSCRGDDCPAGGAGPDSASGGPGAGRESGAALPFAAGEGGRLPFTGFDLLMIACLGAFLLAAGFGVRAAIRVRAGSSA